MNKFTKISATALFALFLNQQINQLQQNLKQLSLRQKLNKKQQNRLKRLNQLKQRLLKNKLTTTNYLNGMQAKRKLKWLHNKNFNLI